MRKLVLLMGGLLFLIISTVHAEGDLLKSFDKRDKFYDISMWNNKLWTAGYPGQLLTTDSKGLSWSKNKIDTISALYSLCPVDKSNAIVNGPDGLVLQTSDGGKSWSKVVVETGVPLFDCASLLGGNDIWVVGHFNTIFHSADKGKTFKAQQYILPEDAEDEPGLNAITFLDKDNGWIVGEFGIILKTTDGGKTWLRVKSPTTYSLYDITFIDNMRGVIVGAEGGVYTTADGGETWITRDIPIRSHFFSVTVTANNTIHTVGQDGYYAQLPFSGTGKTIAKRTGVFIWLNSIFFIDDKLGFAAGGRGTIVKTTDGGYTWLQLSGR